MDSRDFERYPGELAGRPGIRAFSLVEMLVVLAVIAVLAALAIGAVSRALESADITKSANQMLQIHRAVLLWAADNNNRLPSADNQQWYPATYPYLMNGQQLPPLIFVPWDTAANLKRSPFYCPLKDRSGEGTPVRSYAWNWRLADRRVSPAQPLPLPRVRQPSKTMMLVTSKNTSQIDATSNLLQTISTRCGGTAIVVFVDGHIEKRTLNELEEESPTDPFWRPE